MRHSVGTRPKVQSVQTEARAQRQVDAFAWDIWLVRAVLLVSAGWALVGGQRDAALGCAVILAGACVPLLGAGVFGARVPRVVERVWVVGLGVIGVSVGFGLFDSIWHWGKLVHAVEAIWVTTIAAVLLLGYRDRAQPGLPIHVAALASMCLGITFGAVWEFTEYLLDWMRYSDLQKSNADTMTDMLWNDLAAITTTVLVFHLYHHRLSLQTQRSIGQFVDALVTPIGKFLDRHGKLAAVLILGSILAYVIALWFSGRPIPGLPTG